MTAYERMTAALEATGLYHFADSPRMAAEMAAYGAALDTLYQQLREILYGAFLDEEDNLYAARQERLFGFSRTRQLLEPLDVALRQQKIAAMKKRLSITNEDFNAAGIQKALESYGLTVTLKESPATGQVAVTVTADAGLLGTEAEKCAVIQDLMPAHVTAAVTFST